MAILVIKDASVTIGGVDLSSYVTSVTVNYEIEAVSADAMGSNRVFTGGLQNNTIDIALNQDFAATKTEATIFPLVGTTTTVVVKPTSAAVSATNPSYTLTGGYIASHTPVAGAVGELMATTIQVQGGTLAKATS